MNCPCCNSTRHSAYDKSVLVYRCKKCGAVFGSCWLGDSYAIVKPSWHQGEAELSDTFYFDLECLGSAGITRRHGWAHKETRQIVQVG